MVLVPRKFYFRIFNLLCVCQIKFINLTWWNVLFWAKKSVLWLVLIQTKYNWLCLIKLGGVLCSSWQNLCLVFVELPRLPLKIKVSKTSDTWGPISQTKRWSLVRMAFTSGCCRSSMWLWRKLAVHGQVASMLLWEGLPNGLRWVLFLAIFLSLRHNWSNIGLSFVPLDILCIHFWVVICSTFASAKEVVSLDFLEVWILSHGPLLERILIDWFVHFAIF